MPALPSEAVQELNFNPQSLELSTAPEFLPGPHQPAPAGPPPLGRCERCLGLLQKLAGGFSSRPNSTLWTVSRAEKPTHSLGLDPWDI